MTEQKDTLKSLKAYMFGKYVNNTFYVYYVHESAIEESGTLSIDSWKERLEATSHDVMELSVDDDIRKYVINYMKIANSIYPILPLMTNRNQEVI